MSDYEMAAMKVINEQFPTAEIHGCWFHYNQALLRQWRRLGLMDAPRSVLSMIMTMALIPSDCFEEALSFIQLEVDQISQEYPAVNDFLAYVRKTWLPLASKVSVYDCPARTNNITECFHSIVGRKFGKSQNIWSFLDNLRKLIIDEELKLKRLKSTEISGHYTSIKSKIRDNKILKLQKYFATGRLHLNSFLRSFNDTCEDILKNDLLLEGNNNNPIFDQRYNYVHPETNSNTLCNTENEAKINIKRQTPLQELNLKETNTSHAKCCKRKWDLLNTDKDDKSIYEVSKNEYLPLIDNSASTEDLPYYAVNWNLKDNQNTSKEVSSIDTYTVCLANERTYVFIPCDHLACCHLCIECLESTRCSICNIKQLYKNY
ncbi:uncharacterized protein LOC143898430 isoform X1 [Temnothorax americanus]|uniref:uncharacterized protein LOC143898430 isoform X1 n=1 Tax=Temnothorax americanus TaxID=1964332 RepID=UPI00406759B6